MPKTLPKRLGLAFLGLDVLFWLFLFLANVLFPHSAADNLVFLPTLWYTPASLLLTSIPSPLFSEISLGMELFSLAMLGSFQHFIFGYCLGLLADFLRKRA